jgi:hypothetical protein
MDVRRENEFSGYGGLAGRASSVARGELTSWA